MSFDVQVGKLVEERYEILAEIGRGGAGSILKAYDKVLERTVALKFILPEALCDEEDRLRFMREGMILSKLDHRNVVTFFNFGSAEGYPFIVLEYVDGKNLRELLNETGQLSVERAVFLASQICSGLQAAHDIGIIHRDVKPTNILLSFDDGLELVKLADFGLSGLSKSSSIHSPRRLTGAGMLIGSVAYMSAEQAVGQEADSRSDLYSAGCILYEMLSGSQPFTCDNPVGLLTKHACEEPEPLSKFRSDLPHGLEAVILKAMAKKPDERYQSANEMKDDLDDFLNKPAHPLFGSLLRFFHRS